MEIYEALKGVGVTGVVVLGGPLFIIFILAGHRICQKVLGRDMAPSWMPEAERQLQALLDLPANWDSYGADRVRPEMVEVARKILGKLAGGGYDRPHISPLNDGSLQFEWERGKRSYEVEFDTVDRAICLYVDDGEMTTKNVPVKMLLAEIAVTLVMWLADKGDVK